MCEIKFLSVFCWFPCQPDSYLHIHLIYPTLTHTRTQQRKISRHKTAGNKHVLSLFNDTLYISNCSLCIFFYHLYFFWELFPYLDCQNIVIRWSRQHHYCRYYRPLYQRLMIINLFIRVSERVESKTVSSSILQTSNKKHSSDFPVHLQYAGEYISSYPRLFVSDTTLHFDCLLQNIFTTLPQCLLHFYPLIIVTM